MHTIVSYMTNGQAVVLPVPDHQTGVTIGQSLHEHLDVNVEVLTTINGEGWPAPAAKKKAPTKRRLTSDKPIRSRPKTKRRALDPEGRPARTLAFLQEQDAARSSGEVAEHLKVTRAQASGALSGLLESGRVFARRVGREYLWSDKAGKFPKKEST